MTVLSPPPSDFDNALWSRAAKTAQPISLAAALELSASDGEPATQLTVWTLVAETQPLDALQRAAGAAAVEARGLGGVGLLRVEDAHGGFVLGVWPAGDYGEESDATIVHLVGSVPVTDPRWRRIESWVRRAAPSIAPFFLGEAELEAIDSSLSEFGRVEVSRVTARVLDDGSSLNRGWASSQQLQRPTMREVVAELGDYAVVRTLTLHVGDTLSLHLRRNGGATYYNGSFGVFEDVVMGRLALAGAERRRLLSDRTRRVNAPIPRPIGLRVPAAPFASPEGLDALLEAMQSQSGVGVAVLHRNPYLQVAVTDYRDGSNFDAFVTSDDELSIHPGFRASLGALTRFTAHLSAVFDARDIFEVPPLPPASLEDLLSTG